MKVNENFERKLPADTVIHPKIPSNGYNISEKQLSFKE